MAQVLHQAPPASQVDCSEKRQDSACGGSSVLPTAAPVGFQVHSGSDETPTLAFPMDALPAPSFTFPAAHGPAPGQRHSRRQMSLALPAFHFNPSAGIDTPNGSARSAPAESISPSSVSSQASPSRNARHVRAQSELPGNGAFGLNAFSGTTAGESEESDSGKVVQTSPTRRGHRHRRSGAVSSQDLSTIAAARPQPLGIGSTTSASNEAQSLSRPPSFSARPSTDILRSAGATPSTSKSSSPVRVSFRNSIEVIPQRSMPVLQDRPLFAETRLIHSSDGRDGVSQSQMTSPSDDVTSLAVTQSSWFSGEADDGGLASEPSELDASVLSNSFFSRPTGELPISPGFSAMPGSFDLSNSADESDQIFGEPGYETVTEDFDGVLVAEAASPSSTVSSPAPWTLPTRRSEIESTDSVLDLDSALNIESGSPNILSSTEMRSLRGKSFSAGRRSMHSSGLPPTESTPLHRRTESAPNLASFEDRPKFKRSNSGSAPRTMFEMENVFEEDEEAAEEEATFVTPRTKPSTPITIDPPRKPLKETRDRSSLDALSDDLSAKAGTVAVGKMDSTQADRTEATASEQSGTAHAPAIRDSMSTITTEYTGQAPGVGPAIVFGESQSAISSPPTTPGASCGKAAMSTSDWLAADNVSSQFSEVSSYVDAQQLEPPRPRFEFGRLSSDGASSLTSSHSTMASGGYQQNSATTSPLTTGSSTLDGPRLRQGPKHRSWHKRASLVSLTRLMSGSGSVQSEQSDESTLRCQTSDGLRSDSRSARASSGKRRTFNRLLHFLKPNKEGKSESNG